MVRVEAPMNDQASPTVRALLLSVALMVTATAVVVVLVADAARIPVAAYGAVATVLVTWGAVEIARRGRRRARSRCGTGSKSPSWNGASPSTTARVSGSARN